MVKQLRFVLASALLTAITLAGKSVELVMAIQQEGAPVKIVQTKSTQDFGFDEVSIKNVSTHAIQSITLAVVFHALPVDRRDKPVLSRTVSTNVNLKPEEEQTLQSHALRYDQMPNSGPFTSKQILAELGVLSVEYAGGAVWSFDPISHRGFTPKR